MKKAKNLLDGWIAGGCLNSADSGVRRDDRLGVDDGEKNRVAQYLALDLQREVGRAKETLCRKHQRL